MANFGALTDHFGFTGAGEVFETIGELVASSKVARAQSRADAQDENNDIAASSYYGNTAGEIFDVSCTYAVKSGTLDTADIDLGELSAGIVVSGVTVDTSNGGWPQVTVTGQLGTETITAPTGYLNTFTLPSISILGIKQAQVISFTVTTGRLTGSSLTASIEIAEQADGEGEPVAHGVSGGTMEISASFVNAGTVPAWTVTGDFTETQPPSVDEGQAAWHTASASAAGTLTRNASA